MAQPPGNNRGCKGIICADAALRRVSHSCGVSFLWTFSAEQAFPFSRLQLSHPRLHRFIFFLSFPPGHRLNSIPARYVLLTDAIESQIIPRPFCNLSGNMPPKRKRGPTLEDSTMSSPPSLLDQIRNMEEFASLGQYLFMFGIGALKLPDFGREVSHPVPPVQALIYLVRTIALTLTWRDYRIWRRSCWHRSRRWSSRYDWHLLRW